MIKAIVMALLLPILVPAPASFAAASEAEELDKPLTQTPPKAVQQVFFDVIFVDPRSADPMLFSDHPPQKHLMNGIAFSVYQDASIDFAIAKLALTARTYSSMGLLVAQKETSTVDTERFQFKIHSTILKNDLLQINLSQNLVNFACSSGSYCRSDANLILKNGETVAIAVESKHAQPKYSVMLLTPRILRSPADFAQITKRKKAIAEHFKQP